MLIKSTEFKISIKTANSCRNAGDPPLGPNPTPTNVNEINKKNIFTYGCGAIFMPDSVRIIEVIEYSSTASRKNQLHVIVMVLNLKIHFHACILYVTSAVPINNNEH